MYAKTPFGVMKSAVTDTENRPAPHGKVATKVIDKGDTVRFEQAGPFGPLPGKRRNPILRTRNARWWTLRNSSKVSSRIRPPSQIPNDDLQIRSRRLAASSRWSCVPLLEAQQPPAQTQPAQPAVTVPGAFKFNGASLLEVIDILAGELHINYVVDPSIKGGTVTMTTYGTVRDVDIRPLLETILRMNNLAMVQVGEFYRIVPAGNIAQQPVSPVSQTDSSKMPDDERLVLNLVFLHYVTSARCTRC